MDSAQLRWGIMGCGKVASDFVKAFEKAKRSHKIVAVAAMSSVEKAEEFIVNNALTGPRALEGYQALLDDNEVDIVYVGMQTAWHYEWAKRALHARKHVLVETPLAVTAAQAAALAAEARRVRRLLVEGFWSRHFPAYAEIRRLCESGDLGEARAVNANFGFPFSPESTDPANGRTIMSTIGCYVVNLAQMVFGCDPVEVSASGDVDEETGAEVWAAITVKYGGARYAVLHCDSRALLPNTAFVLFERGYVEIPEWMHAPTKLRYFQTGSANGGAELGSHAQKEFRLDDKRNFNYPNSTGFRYEQDHVYDVIYSGQIESTVMSWADTIRIRDVIDKAREQLGAKQPDPVPEPDLPPTPEPEDTTTPDEGKTTENGEGAETEASAETAENKESAEAEASAESAGNGESAEKPETE